MSQQQVYHEPLSPINTSDKEVEYRPFLDYAMDKENILNIAVTAPKGAGKSSVINTYLNNCPERGRRVNVINVSVAQFEKNTDSTNEKNNQEGTDDGTEKDKNSYRVKKDLNEQRIETKILNQIINQINPQKIPESIFHIDRRHKFNRSLCMAVCSGLMFLFALYLFSLPLLTNHIYTRMSGTIIPILIDIRFTIGIAVLLTILVGISVFVFFKNYSYKRLPKITINDCSLDPVIEGADTMFNKYLDEMLYMIIASECNAIVFEDLERLNDNSIWEKLREINYILNKRIDNKNLAENTKRHNRKNVKPEKAKQRDHVKFIYVTRDSLFGSKDRVKFFDYIIPIIPIVDKSNSLEVIKRISEKNGINIDESFLGSVNVFLDDMRIINNIFNEMSVYERQLNNNDNENILTTYKGDEDNLSKANLNNTKLFAMLIYKNILPLDFEKFQFHQGVVYSILEKLAKMRGAETIYAAPEDYLDNFDDEYDHIAYNTEGIEQFNSNSYDLVKYLIKYGYISLSDTEYNSYYYTDNLSDNERNFILQVKHNQKTNMLEVIKNAPDVINRLKDYINSERILNCYIVEHIMRSMEVYRPNILQTIKRGKNFVFVKAFIIYLVEKNETELLKKFIIRLNLTWNSICLDMQKNNEILLLKHYAELSLCYCEKDIISIINVDNTLTRLFNEAYDINGGTVDDNRKLIENLKFINVKCAKLNKQKTSNDIWVAVYANNLFEINKFMLENYFALKDFWTKSYTYISEIKSMKAYIDSNIENYFELYVGLKQYDSTLFYRDDEKVVIELLNNKKISLELKERYISRLKTQITDINTIQEKKLWDSLLKFRLAKESVDTILSYFNSVNNPFGKYNNGIYSLLTDYISGINDFSKLDFKIVDWNRYGNNIKSNFYKYIIVQRKLNKESAEYILKSADNLEYELDEIGDVIEPGMIYIMINNDILNLSVTNFQRIINSQNIKNIRTLVRKYCNIFCVFLKDEKINIDGDNILLELLCETNDVNDIDEKLQIAKAYKGPIAYNVQYYYSDALSIEILNNHFDVETLDRFFEKYDRSNNEMKNLIFTKLRECKYISDYKSALSQHDELYNRLTEAGVLN